MKSNKFSFFYPVADLDIRFKLRKSDEELTTTERKLPTYLNNDASTHHAALRKACKETQKALNKKDTDLKGNLAASRFSIFYTETLPEEGSFGDDIYELSFDIGPSSQKKGKAYSPGDFYTEKTNQNGKDGAQFVRYTNLVTDISNRINLFERVYATTANPLFNIKSITRIADFNAALDKGDFTGNFHHTEQVILEVSSRLNTYDKLKKILPREDIYVLGGCHDLHSNLCVCPQCSVGLVASHHSHERGLIYSLKKSITEVNPRNEFYDSFFWTTRVSCANVGKNAGESFTDVLESTKSRITYDLNKTERPFLQALYSKLNIDAASPVESEYTGSVFSSRVIHKQRKK